MQETVTISTVEYRGLIKKEEIYRQTPKVIFEVYSGYDYENAHSIGISDSNEAFKKAFEVQKNLANSENIELAKRIVELEDKLAKIPNWIKKIFK